MRIVPRWLRDYGELPRDVHAFATGHFFINLVTAAQFLLLNLFLKSHGLDDPEIAALSSQRFVATFFLAVPLGLWLRGRPLRRILLAASVIFPATALLSLETVRMGMIDLTSWIYLAMGCAGLFLNVCSIPMIMRLAPEDKRSECLSLLFSTWAAASICSGLLAAGLQSIGSLQFGSLSMVFDEYVTLIILTIASFTGPFFFAKIAEPEALRKKHHWLHFPKGDRAKIARVLIPTLCIATGAGMSIQFLNLFFYHVHNLGAATYSLFGTIGQVLVLISGLLVPTVRRRFGWRGAILGVQSISIILLVAMALTELGSTATWALPLALICFVLRQPLMNMAGPSTSELTMTYAGDENRELVSACNGAVWGGSWWLAARIFEFLRASDFPYWIIFMITAALYLAGTVAYLGLIRSVESSALRKQKAPGQTNCPDAMSHDNQLNNIRPR